MKSANRLTTVRRTFEMDDDEKIALLNALPDEKLLELFDSAISWFVVCESCGENTVLLASEGRNCKSECHHCGETYRAIG